MASYTYTARSFSGDLRTATLEASSRDDVIAQLRRQRLSVVKIDEATAKKPRRGHIKMRDVVIFTRQFSTMINAGLPLVQALTILAEQSQNRTLSDITRKVVFDVESGNTVADAMGKHPQAFSPLYVNMVAAGEAGGILDTILLRLSRRITLARTVSPPKSINTLCGRRVLPMRAWMMATVFMRDYAALCSRNIVSSFLLF